MTSERRVGANIPAYEVSWRGLWNMFKAVVFGTKPIYFAQMVKIIVFMPEDSMDAIRITAEVIHD